MKIKKLISGISALAVAASAFAGLALTANAETAWYSQDFTGVTDASTVAKSTNAQGQLVISKDDLHGDYLSFDFSSQSDNSRGAYMNFTGVDVTAEDKYIVEFDAALKPGNNQGSAFAVKGTDFAYISNNINYGAGTGYVLKMTCGNNTTYTINDTASATAEIPSGEWCHYKLYVDKQQKLVSTTITNAGGTAIVDKLATSYNGNGNVAGIYMLAGRYYPVQSVDNIVVRAVAAGDEFGELGTEELSSVEFTSQLNTTVSQPAEDTPVHLPVAIKATGTYGSDLTEAEGLDIKWSVTGLGEEDGYISLTKEPGTEVGTVGDSPDGSASAYFNVRNGVSNWYGSVTATVTYLEKELSITTPFAVIGASGSGNNLAPAAGYPEDMSSYADDLVGYKATANGINDRDLVLNSWSIYGSNGARTLTLNKDEDGTKYLRFASNSGSGSTVGVYQLAEQSSQYIVDMKVRFTGAMSFGHYSNTPNNGDNNPNWTASYGGGALNIGTQSISGLSNDHWFRIIVSADESAGTYWAKVYDEDGNFVGETTSESLYAANAKKIENKVAVDIEPPVPSYTMSQKYFCFQGTYPVDLASFRIYYPTPASLTVNTDAETIQVPESDTPATANLSAIMKDTDGYTMSGKVTWSLGDEYAGVSIDENGVLSVTNEAGSGVITVVAAYGSMRSEKEISLSTTGNTVVFTKTASSITIPFEGEDSVEGEFAAEARDKDGVSINAAVSYQMVDATGEEVTGLRGVSFDAVSGKLTVAPGAAAKTVYIKATAVVNEETLTTRAKVSIHGLSFAFGSAAPEDDSYTQVTAADAYTDKLGYGFANTSVISDEENNVKGSAAYTFKAKVPNGNYNITINTSAASMTSEVVENIAATTGISKSGANFSVAVCDGVLDLTFPADSTVATLSIAQAAAKQKLEKPMLYAIGDSTTKNNADGNISWGNVVTQEMIPEAFSGFANHGMAGRDSVSYYNQGRVEAVLLAINPGDYVTVNMGINSKETGEWASFPTLVSNYYVDGIIQRGGIPIITTATPGGPTRFYANGTFTSGRGDGAHNNDLRAIAAEKGLETIELGQHFEDVFNSYTEADVEAYNSEQGTSFTSVYDMVASWYGDHNHYKQYLADQIAGYMLGEAAKIAGETPVTTYTVTFTGENADVTIDEATVTEKTVDAGTELTFKVTPADGYQIDAVKLGDETLTADGDGNYKITVNSDITVTITATEAQPPVVEEKIDVKSASLNGKTLTAEISNTTKEAVNIAAMVAVYDTYGMLVKVIAAQKEIAADGTESFNIENDGEGVTVKAFIWNMSQNLTPLTEAIQPAE